MHKYIRLILLIVVIAAMGVVIGRYSISWSTPAHTSAPPVPAYVDSQAVAPWSGPKLIKAVHYFASAWPKNFWEDFERSQVDKDFAQIKADGFNTVILVVPWLGFETGFDDGAPEPSELYDRLDWLLAKIDQNGLGYALRVSFPHGYDTENGIVNHQLCKEIYVDSERRMDWLNYISRIGQQINRHRDAFRFAFFSWEDFFCSFIFPKFPLDQRLEIARDSGYQDWLAENFPRQLVEFLYMSSFETMDAVPVPQRSSSATWFWLHFIDDFLINQLLIPARQYLPELAMEVRVDRDRSPLGEQSFWTSHDLALSDDRLRGSYWGPYHGARNESETLSASEALRGFDYMLNSVTANGQNTHHVVEQFNFIDNTPGLVHAKIDESELSDFLEGAADLIKEKSMGYGLWAYHDYVDSAIYNGSFELDLRGWETEGGVTLITNDEGDRAIQLQANGRISQEFAPYARFISLHLSENLTFCANFKPLQQGARINLSINDTDQGSFEVDNIGQQCFALDIAAIRQPKVEFSLSTDAEIEIDDLRLYGFVQRLHVYDENGQPGSIRELIVRLNTEWLGD